MFCVAVCVAAKKPSETMAKARKPAAPKTKKPDKSIWDSDSDTMSKKPSSALKGKGLGLRRSLIIYLNAVAS